MCGRFAFYAEKEEVEEIFHPLLFEFWSGKNYNIAPGQDIFALISSDGFRGISLRWGLVPAWAKNPAIGNKMINARAETVAEKPSFKKPFLFQRCVFPASGFFEWKQIGQNKIPYFIRFRSGKLMLFAGLYDRWQKPDRTALTSGTIITRPALPQYSDIHQRMPAILRYQAALRWLSEKDSDPQNLKQILEEIDDDEIEVLPASDFVKNLVKDILQCSHPQ